MPIPYEVRTERLSLRCYQPGDAESLQRSVAESKDHLAPWMPWAVNEPQSLEEKISLIRGFRHKYDGDIDYVMGIFELEQNRLVGGTGLHPRVGPDAFEIGYWVHPDFVRKGYATETAAALTHAAFKFHHVNRVEIHVDPRNRASSAIPEKLGFQLEGTLRKRLLDSDKIARDSMIWTILKEEYSDHSNELLHKYAIQGAFDFRGEKI